MYIRDHASLCVFGSQIYRMFQFNGHLPVLSDYVELYLVHLSLAKPEMYFSEL